MIFMQINLFVAIVVYVGCICDPVISVRVLRLLHNNSDVLPMRKTRTKTAKMLGTKRLLHEANVTTTIQKSVEDTQPQ